MLNAENRKLEIYYFPYLWNAKIKFVIELRKLAAMSGSYLVWFEGLQQQLWPLDFSISLLPTGRICFKINISFIFLDQDL